MKKISILKKVVEKIKSIFNSTEAKTKSDTPKEEFTNASKESTYKKEPFHVEDTKKERSNELTPELILDILSKNKSGIKQTQLYIELPQFSRQKITALLAKMDKEEAIKREKKGTSYTVFSKS